MIILINGSINSGKTTISKLLSQRLSKAAHIEVDSLREFIRPTPLAQAIPINLKNTIAVSKIFIEEGYDVIISYPLNREETKNIVSELSNLDNEIYFFTLDPKLENAITNRGTRELEPSEVERVKYLYQKNIHNPGFGIVVDNSSESPDNTVDTILNHIKNKEMLNINEL